MSLATARYCPNCNADLQGAAIPEADREAFGDATHFRRVIGIEHLGGYDGVAEWQCPDCNYRESRFTGREITEAS